MFASSNYSQGSQGIVSHRKDIVRFIHDVSYKNISIKYSLTLFQFLKSHFCSLLGFLHEVICDCYVGDSLLLHPWGKHFLVLRA